MSGLFVWSRLEIAHVPCIGGMLGVARQRDQSGVVSVTLTCSGDETYILTPEQARVLASALGQAAAGARGGT